MKSIYLFLAVIVLTCTTTIAQVTVSGSTGANGTYATLTDASAITGAFAAINAAGTQAGNNILITIGADIVETDLTALFAGDWNTLTINPTGGASRQVSTAVNGSLIHLNGADNVTIDGLNSSGNALNLTNTSGLANAVTIRLSGDASNNTIRRCTILGSTGSLSGSGLATLYFGVGSTTGNDDNTITQCTISSSATGTALNAIQSVSIAAGVSSNNIISGNSIADFFHPDISSCGISIGAFNSDWIITGNKLFQTATRIATTGTTHNGINITSGSGYSISDNTIGFANAAGTGTTNIIGLTTGSLGGTFPSAFTPGGTANATRYNGINCAFSAGGSSSSIQNNTIAGIALYTSSAATATFGLICGIAVTSGSANIGTTTGNTIGTATGTSSIYAATTAAGAVIAGIYCSSSNTINIQNNTIGGIDASGTTLSRSTGFKGIDIAGTGTFTVSNNTVGNATANNIRTGYLLTGANLSNTATTPTEAFGGGVVRAIVSSATGATLDITGNIIQGFHVSGNSSTYTGISSTGTVTSTMNINANQVGNTVANAVTFPFATSAGIFGISVIANAGTMNLNNNSIYGISTPWANSITGIITSTGLATATLNINNNSFINNTISGSTVSTPMIGITNAAIVSTLNITGNVIRSNSSTATTDGFTGIQNSGAVVNAVNITNNQLGDVSGGAVTFTTATTGTINGIKNTNAANTATININSNSLNGFSVVNTGQIFFIQNTAGNAAAVNMNNNQLGTLTGSLISFSGVQSSSLHGIYNPSGNAGVMAVSILNNDIRGIVQTATGTASQQYINCQAPVLSGNISNNTFTNLSINSSGQVILILKGGAMNAGGSCIVNNNSIVGSFSKTAAGNNVIMYLSAPASLSGSTLTISGNNFSNITTTGGTAFYGIEDHDGSSAASAPTKTISGNTINNVTMGTGSFNGLLIDKGENLSISSNTISNVSTDGSITALSHLSNAGTGTLNISSNTISSLSSTLEDVNAITGGSASPTTINIYNNIITDISSGGNDKLVIGILNTNAQTANIYDNAINNLTGFGAGTAVVNGIWVSGGTTINIYRNKIDTFEQSGVTSASPAVNGMLFSGGTTVTAYNNFLANLNASNAVLDDAVRGISLTSTTAASSYNLYFNSIYLHTSSGGANFGTTGIFHTANATGTTARLNMINNIVVNISTPNGTGIAAAYRRSGTTLSNYDPASDHNLFYAGTSSANRLIFYDGINSDQTLAAYQTRVTTRDANSISLMPAFISETDIHLTPANCRIDGRGIPVGGITDDIDLATRNATTPDIGADEFTAATSTTLAGVTGSAVCEDRNVLITGTTFRSNSCDIIATVLPSGGNPVAGKVNVCVTLDATQQTFNGEPYVQRHFDAEPANSNQTTTSATITLYFTDAEFALYNSTNSIAWPRLPTVSGGANADPNRTNLKVTQFHGAAGTSPSSPGNYPGTRILIDPLDGDIFWNGSYWAVTFDVTGFSGFYVHTNNFNAPLPVIVNYLTGRRQGSNHLLNWKVTCATSPRAAITLERSSDGRNYSGLYTITADAARCQQPFDYIDANLLKGMNYYRLKIVDADGKITYSTTVALLNAVKGFDIISIAPNPVVTNNFKLNVASAQGGEMELVIFDMQGRLVNKQTLSLIAGFNSMPVNISNLSRGTYTLKAGMGNDESKVIRFVKQ
jgi:hypothetical protein